MSEKRTKVLGINWKTESDEQGVRQLAHKDRIVLEGSNEGNVRNYEKSKERRTSELCANCTNISNEAASKENENQNMKNEMECGYNGDAIVQSEATESLEFRKNELIQFVAEITKKLKAKAQLRCKNGNVDPRPEEAFFSKLDSSLKKNTAFIKRLKNITEAQKDSLAKDINSLNLTKYISEAATAIVDAKLKMSDVSAAVQICSMLHQRYAEFSTHLLEQWHKVLLMRKDESISNPSKIRVDLRFYADLLSCRVFDIEDGLPLLGKFLTFLIASDKEQHVNVHIVLSFCRHCGEDFTGLVPRKYRILSEKFGMKVPTGEFLPSDRQQGLRYLLKEYYKSLCKHLIRDYKILQNRVKQNRKILEAKGELSILRKQKNDELQSAFQKLLSTTQQFADLIDEDVPDVFNDETFVPDNDITVLDGHNSSKEEAENTLSAWDDYDTRCFYENLTDLKAIIPGILFKDSSQTSESTEDCSEKLEDDLSKLDMEDSEVLNVEVEKCQTKDSSMSEEYDFTETLMQEIEDTSEGNATSSIANESLLDGFLRSLLNCVNTELIDRAAVNFCMNLNTRSNRKKLVRSLFLVPRTRLDILPFFARFVATLNPCMPDVASDLVIMLKKNFIFHVKKKDQINIESKVKIVRFIGELVNFKVYPKSEALFCLKVLFSNFVHHHIQMACYLLETCGRFLFLEPDSHQRTKVLLDQMLRKKSVMPINSYYATMIENAFYCCNPPELPPTVIKKRPPMHEYIRKLLYSDLTKNTNNSTETYSANKVLRQMRKLDWEDSETAAYITKCLIAVWNAKFYNIRRVANLLANLVFYQEDVGPQVIDGVLEEIRLGMEINHPKYNQRRISTVRYLSELFMHRMVESSVIFRVLYSLITFGVNYDGSYSELDPPEHLLRIHLVCNILEICGPQFVSHCSKKKLDCFLVFFQRYYWHKLSSEIYNKYTFPVTIKFLVVDTISALRPNLGLYESLEEAVEGIEDLIKELKPKIAEVCPNLMSHEEIENQEYPVTLRDISLGPIQEVDEDPDDDANDDEDTTEGDTDDHSGSQSQPYENGNGKCCGISQAGNKTGHSALNRNRQGSSVVYPITRKVKCAKGGDFMSAMDQMLSETVFPKSGVKTVSEQVLSVEDENFTAAYDKMLSESIFNRNLEHVKPQIDIVLPMNIIGSQTKEMPSLHVIEEEKHTMNFMLMTRKGNKQQFKNLAVPVTSELAQNLKDRQLAERLEKQRVKLLTLNITKRQEEEDYKEMLAAQQRLTVMNLNRDCQ